MQKVKGNTDQDKKAERRRKLLAAVHIAKMELDLLDEDYREILQEEFKARSAKALSNRDLIDLLKLFESKGWKSKAQNARQRTQKKTQAQALKEKAVGMLSRAVDEGFVRDPRGLVRKICGVDDIEWCGEAVRLKKLLAALKNISEGGHVSQQSRH